MGEILTSCPAGTLNYGGFYRWSHRPTAQPRYWRRRRCDRWTPRSSSAHTSERERERFIILGFSHVIIFTSWMFFQHCIILAILQFCNKLFEINPNPRFILACSVKPEICFLRSCIFKEFLSILVFSPLFNTRHAFQKPILTTVLIFVLKDMHKVCWIYFLHILLQH